MLQPKRTKFRKVHKGRNGGLAQRGNKVSFGEFGLRGTGRGNLASSTIAGARWTVSRRICGVGMIGIWVFPDKHITQKPLEVRMGKGNGSVEFWVAQIQPGKVLYEAE